MRLVQFRYRDRDHNGIAETVSTDVALLGCQQCDHFVSSRGSHSDIFRSGVQVYSLGYSSVYSEITQIIRNTY